MECVRKRQLLTDCLERVQALAVEMELLIRVSEQEKWFRVEQTAQEVKIVLTPDRKSNCGWLRMEEARIQCDIARLALDTHIATHGC